MNFNLLSHPLFQKISFPKVSGSYEQSAKEANLKAKKIVLLNKHPT